MRHLPIPLLAVNKPGIVSARPYMSSYKQKTHFGWVFILGAHAANSHEGVLWEA